MLGDQAQALVQDSSRSQQTGTLLPYATTLIRSVIRESQSLSSSILATAEAYQASQANEPDLSVQAEMTVSAVALRRNHRALVVYHTQRADILRDALWKAGGQRSIAYGAQTQTRRHMATVDEVFARGYADLCLAFKTSYLADPDDRSDDQRGQASHATSLMDAVDLLGGGVDAPPPKEVNVTVRVLGDVGDVETASGARLSLTRGSQYFLPREDVENMIVGGLVEIID